MGEVESNLQRRIRSTLLRGVKEENLRKIRFPCGTEPGYMQDTIAWPLGDIIPDTATGIDMKAIEDITRKVIGQFI